MKNRVDLMVDLETLGPAPDGAIVAIGWCAFEPLGKIVAHGKILVNPTNSKTYGRVDQDTLVWWSQQPVEVQKMLDPNLLGNHHLPNALFELGKKYVMLCEASDLKRHTEGFHTRLTGREVNGRVWAYPATFDLSILDLMFVRTEMVIPWSRKDYACAKSVINAWRDLTGFSRDSVEIPAEFQTKHDPEADAVRQVIQLQSCLKGMKSHTEF